MQKPFLYFGLFFILIMTVLSCSKPDSLEPMNPTGPIDPTNTTEYDGRLNHSIDIEILQGHGVDAAYNGGKWIVAGDGVYISTDATKWEEVPSVSEYVHAVEAGAGKFVIMTYDKLLASTNGLTWQQVLTFSGDSKGLYWTGSNFLARKPPTLSLLHAA